MSDKNLQKEEILSGEDEKICQMLGDLKRVDAPNDFDFRLKARIAAAEPRAFKPRLFPSFRIAAPLGLALAVLAFFVISGLYSVDNNSVPQIAENNVPAKEYQSEPKEFVTAGNSQPEKSGETDTPLKPKDSEVTANPDKPKKDAPQTEDNGGGSRDSAVRDTNVFLPGGFGSKNSIPVKDVLQIIGIEASFSDKKWKVKSIMPNSRAERAGVKTGDIIDAINDVKLPAKTINLNGAFVGKKMTVVRGVEKIEIDLQNQ